MANPTWVKAGEVPASTTVTLKLEDMEMIDDHKDSWDFEYSESVNGNRDNNVSKEDVRQRIAPNVTEMMWEMGAQSAKKAWSIYGNIDILRPYFDVEPKEVQKRLLYSLIPHWPTSQQQKIPRELYGPTMVVLTMIALLLYQMKSAEHRVTDGTLMGSALGVCFAYWFGASCLVWVLSYVFSVKIVLIQVMSMVGYGMFGHCIVLFLGTLIHTSHDHAFFYLLWVIFGGLATLRMATILISRTKSKTDRLVVIGCLSLLHMMFLLYLHFAYHKIVEELSDAFQDKLVPLPLESDSISKQSDTGNVAEGTPLDSALQNPE
ncbi:protein YIPF3-like isoform X1 [Pomacea canaliculata]|uniref:protein YIPF3-like isoform X1 n=1 Tax=Pomacea canaliculata TaxID=400727 RepID=UPI000D72569F|nr:protein YIPF3-like isoform X1 [Pomacea canaliculata]